MLVNALLPGLQVFAQQLNLGVPIDIFTHSDYDRGEKTLTILCGGHQRDIPFTKIQQLYELSDSILLRALEDQLLDIKYTIATYEF